MTNIIKKVALFFKGNSYSTPKINNDLFSHVDTSSKITLKSLEKLSKTNSNNISRLNEYCNRLSEMVSEIYKENQELKEENQKLSKKIDELNGKFHGMANWFALPQSVSQEEKEKFNISIESLLEDYKTLTLKNFKEKYSNYKVIGLENADLIRVNRNLQPNFSEIATGKYLAIELENSIYSVYLQKNLNLYDDIFDGIGVTFIFEFDIEPLLFSPTKPPTTDEPDTVPVAYDLDIVPPICI